MMMLSEAAHAMNGQLKGQDHLFSSVEFDTRRLEKDALFFAIHGESKDGHDFIAEAATKKISAAVADAHFDQAEKIKHIKVDDTTIALGKLAAHWRQSFDIPVVGITGSNGKTTICHIAKCIFKSALPGVAPQGSFNNQWGVPLTLLKLRKGDQFALIEMGMNHAGELSYLGKIVRPTIGLISNASAAHLEGLKTIEGVAQAKGELIDQTDKKGVVVLNHDDAFYQAWRKRAAGREVISFGKHVDAGIRLLENKSTGLQVVINNISHDFEFALLGQHNQQNAAAAIAVALAASIPISQIGKGLKQARAVSGRLETVKLKQGVTLIDDSYNANKASMQAAIDVLAAQKGQTILVLGAMGEQGDQSQTIHEEVAAYAKASGVNTLFTLYEPSINKANYAKDCEAYLQGFGKGAKQFSEIGGLCDALMECAQIEGTILIKGSRFCRMERIADSLKTKFESQEKSIC